jgi:hypothetical protein
MDWAPVAGFVGVLAGGLLSYVTTRHQQRDARAERIETQRVELYSEWINGMNRLVYSKLDKPIDILRIKLLLLEPDAKLRDLVANVQAAVPDPLSKDGEEFYYLLPQDPDPSWLPFDDAVEKLTEAVRASVHR